MEFLISCLMCLLLFLVLAYSLKQTWAQISTGMTIPGPFSLPFIGNLYQLAFRAPHLALTELAKCHGDIFLCSFLGQRCVIVNNAINAREALVTRRDDFAGRLSHVTYVASLVTGNGRDLVFADFGPPMMKMRKIIHSAIHMYGANFNVMEMKICEEIQKLSERIKEKNGEEFDPEDDVRLTVMNTIVAVLFKDRYEINHPEFRKMLKITEFLNEMCSYSHPVNIFSWLSYLPLPSLKKAREAIAYRDEVYRKKYLEHKQSFDPDNVRDLTDGMIKSYSEELSSESRDDEKDVDEDKILVLINDVFVAGFETQSTTVYWVLLFMVAYPDVQKRAHAELDRVIGHDRLPLLNDRGQLPYIEAIIAEVLRMASVLPLGIPHKAIRDTTLGGYDIPQSTGVMFNVWAIHHDEREWSEPYSFNPSRFIDEQGKCSGIGSRAFLPFGAGRRVCVGESLAKAQLFLITSRLLHMFELRKPPRSHNVDLEGVMRASLGPKKYKLNAVARL